MARPLHISAVAVGPLLLLMFAGCVLPPTLGVEKQDAGINSPPSITSVRSELKEYTEPGPITLEVAATSGALSLKLLDTDLSDTLYPKVYVNYNNPIATPARSTCTPAPGDMAERTSTCPLVGVCTTAESTGGPHLLQIVVFDRQVLDSGMPLYQAAPPGALSSSRTYLLKCI